MKYTAFCLVLMIRIIKKLNFFSSLFADTFQKRNSLFFGLSLIVVVIQQNWTFTILNWKKQSLEMILGHQCRPNCQRLYSIQNLLPSIVPSYLKSSSKIGRNKCDVAGKYYWHLCYSTKRYTKIQKSYVRKQKNPIMLKQTDKGFQVTSFNPAAVRHGSRVVLDR